MTGRWGSWKIKCRLASGLSTRVTVQYRWVWTTWLENGFMSSANAAPGSGSLNRRNAGCLDVIYQEISVLCGANWCHGLCQMITVSLSWELATVWVETDWSGAWLGWSRRPSSYDRSFLTRCRQCSRSGSAGKQFCQFCCNWTIHRFFDMKYVVSGNRNNDVVLFEEKLS